MPLWDKGTGEGPDPRVEAFTAGDDPRLDLRLVPYDCRASQAHVRMLASVDLIAASEAKLLEKELARIAELAGNGAFAIRPWQEDCHTAIEEALTASLGDLGKKVHTGRSRNDQVLTALWLYAKDELAEVDRRCGALATALKGLAERHGSVPLPGYTHTRKAMPSSVAMWAGCFLGALADDRRLLASARDLVDACPLGTGAGYGVPLALDRALVARELGFARVLEEPAYAQLSRVKHTASVLHALSQVAATLDAMASDLVLFSMPELGYFTLDPGVCTGSSIMPHKRNPDVLELVRARHQRVLARRAEVEGIASSHITGYHRDWQLTKGPLMEGLDDAKACLGAMLVVMEGLGVDEERCRAAMTKELYATEEACKLVKQGVPFREAYRRVARKH